MGKTRKEYDEDGVKLTMRTPDYLADMSGQMALGIMENLVGQMTYFYTDKVGMAVGAVGFHALVHLRVLQLLPGSDQSPDVLHLPELRPRGKTSRTPRGSRLPPYLTGVRKGNRRRQEEAGGGSRRQETVPCLLYLLQGSGCHGEAEWVYFRKIRTKTRVRSLAGRLTSRKRCEPF